MTIKRTFIILFLLMLNVSLLACEGKEQTNESNKEAQHEGVNEKNGNEDDRVDEVDIYDFYFINKAPKADEKHGLDELIKIYFSAKNIAIDVAENELYIEPLYLINGIDTFNDPVEFHDKEGLIKIIKKYDVQTWKDDYTTENPADYEDGYGWLLLMQFEDGTVEKYRGNGPLKEEVIPEDFDAFGNDLEEFVQQQIEGAD